MADKRASKAEMKMKKQIDEIRADVAFLRKVREEWLETFATSKSAKEPVPAKPPKEEAPPPKEEAPPRKMTGCPVCDGEPMPMDMNKLVLCRSHASQMFPGMRVEIATPVTVEDDGPGADAEDLPFDTGDDSDVRVSLVDQIVAGAL